MPVTGSLEPHNTPKRRMPRQCDRDGIFSAEISGEFASKDMPYLVVFSAALIAALALTPFIKRLAPHWGIVAEPGGRRKHTRPIPKLGGLAIFAGWVVGVLLIYWLLPPVEPDDACVCEGSSLAVWSWSLAACLMIGVN